MPDLVDNGQVSPVSSRDDELYTRLAHSVFGGEGKLGNAASMVSLTDGKHLLIGQLGPDVILSDLPAALVSVLTNSILHVVGSGSQKQVYGAHAPWMVAMMAGRQAFGNGAIANFPSNAMGGSSPVARYANHAVAKVVGSPLPPPTRIGLENLGPEAVDEGLAEGSVCGSIGLHSDLLSRCATPRTVSTSAGALLC